MARHVRGCVAGLLLAFGISIGTAAGAQTLSELLEKAETAAKGSDFETAYDIWLPLALGGNPVAQRHLGILFYHGEGRPRDLSKSFEWRVKAAIQGDAIAQLDLGVMYANGEGVPQNHTMAFGWFEKAASQGNGLAQYYVGLAYQTGEGVSKDTDRALRYYRMAALDGHPDAFFAVANHYASLNPPYKDEAMFAGGAAAILGSFDASLFMGINYHFGRFTKVNLDTAYMWYLLASGFRGGAVYYDRGETGAKASAALKKLAPIIGEGDVAKAKAAAETCLKATDFPRDLAMCGLQEFAAAGALVMADANAAAREETAGPNEGDPAAKGSESDPIENDDGGIMTLRASDPIGEVKGWEIGYSTALGYEEAYHGCIATGKYPSGSVITVAKDNEGEWWFAVSNENWRSIEDGKEYEVTFRIGRTNWQGKSMGATTDLGSTLVNRGVVTNFIKDFAHSSTLQVIYEGKAIDKFSLSGTRAAAEAVDACFQRKIAGNDPFVSQDKNGIDPFAAKTATPERQQRCLNNDDLTEICKGGMESAHASSSTLRGVDVCLRGTSLSYSKGKDELVGEFQGKSGVFSEKIMLFIRTNGAKLRIPRKGSSFIAYGRIRDPGLYGNAIDNCFLQFDATSIEDDRY